MKKIIPENIYRDLPCSYVAIGCAKGGLQDVKVSVKTDGYATLRDTNKAIRENLKIRKYEYYNRADRITLSELFKREKQGCAIVCVYGHYIYADFGAGTYHSFFNNDDDLVVALWHIM